MMAARTRIWFLALLPVALLAVLSLVVANTGVVSFLRQGVPPVEELTFERVTLAPDLITLEVVNGGPDPVTVAQVIVDDAFWEFTVAPSPTVARLGRATIQVPYPWVQDEPHEVTLLSSTGLTFSHEIPVATVTPSAGPRFFGIFALIGLYVGVIPVAIGLLWYPLLRRLKRRWVDFALALTIGLLVFLGADALHEALESAAQLAGAFQGTLLVVVGTLGAVLLLQMAARTRLEGGGAKGRGAVAFLIALGIGLHNLGEGLAIGAAYSLGEAALGAFLIVGFMLHNTTEGLGIVAPIAQDRPRLRTLAGLGLLAGVPTIFGAWIGGLAYSPLYATLFLAVGAGAIAQVVIALYRVVGRESEGSMWTPLSAGGVLVGLLVMYGTGLLVAV
ncbi:MAG: metal transporter [Gemmatimonadales bacterium]|nr:metal transporter [Gemmatimonadales bacterium]NIN12899.1 metal transporter [Gemmatimonadales bacterium]NIR00186.1 metal transporter [Gemmatimonadales bacterium]NIS65979.1 metal transporter [Gemmatimonadales bacterium]